MASLLSRTLHANPWWPNTSPSAQNQQIASMLQTKEIIGYNLLEAFLNGNDPPMVIHFVCRNPRWLESEPQLLMYLIRNRCLIEAKAIAHSLPADFSRPVLQIALKLSIMHADEALDLLILSKLPRNSRNPVDLTHNTNALALSLILGKRKTASFIIHQTSTEALLSQDTFQNTALHYAAEKGYMRLSLALAEKGGYPSILKTNILGNNSIQCAIAGGHFFLARMLAHRAGVSLQGLDFQSEKNRYRRQGGGVAFPHEPIVKTLMVLKRSVLRELHEQVGALNGIPAFRSSTNFLEVVEVEHASGNAGEEHLADDS